jgi:hypothetical protein
MTKSYNRKFPKAKAIEIWQEALIFENTSRIIQNSAYDTFKKDEDLAFGMQYAAFVNHAYSFELYLKCLLVIELDEYWTGHELLFLFEKLPQQTQQEIIDGFNSITVVRKITQPIPLSGDFSKLLKDGSNSFLDYRYLFEEKQKDINEDYDLNLPMQYIKDYIRHKHPSFINQ